jgi:hypothetical protein
MVNTQLQNKTFWTALTIALVTFLAFWPSLFNDFLHWDDFVLVVGNPLIIHAQGLQLKAIFTSIVTRAYMPLTILSFGIEHALFKLNPFYYHLDNLLLHIGTTWLIFWLGEKRRPLRATVSPGHAPVPDIQRDQKDPSVSHVPALLSSEHARQAHGLEPALGFAAS